MFDHTTIGPARQVVTDLDAKYADNDDYSFLAREALLWVTDDIADYDFDYDRADGEEIDDALVADITRLHEAYRTLLAARDDGLDETITGIMLAWSLCPMHGGDYASCFDDDSAECRAIRMIHPLHDT